MHVIVGQLQLHSWSPLQSEPPGTQQPLSAAEEESTGTHRLTLDLCLEVTCSTSAHLSWTEANHLPTQVEQGDEL